MILVYSTKDSPRLSYTLEYVFSRFLNEKFELTHDKESFIAADQPKINYSTEIIQDAINIKSSGILFEKGIKNITPIYKKSNGKHYLFHIFEKGYDLQFDVFSAVFYMISRYEEYGKGYDFRHSDSVAFEYGFLTEPVVNIWISELRAALQKKYGINLKMPQYKHIPTIDIDNAYAFKYKGVLRYVLATGKNLLKRHYNEISMRFSVLAGKKEDPFDTYDYIETLHNKYGKTPYFFILLANYGKFDKNLNYRNKHYVALIKRLSKSGNVGIHPGYASNLDFNKLQEEVNRLKNILGNEVKISRQHFLRLKFPYTYRNLIKLGIEEDYTMGYSSFPGFRAGTTVPFYFYDLETEKTTGLKIIPFQIMDVALNRYLGLKPDEAIEFSLKIISRIKKYGGIFVSAWHNESLSEYREWTGWRKVYEQIAANG